MKKLPKQKKQKAIVCDLDGTLANDSYRFDQAKEGDKIDWDKYFNENLMIEDKINEDLKKQIISYKENEKYKILLLTGRPTFLKNVTVKWLKQNGVPFDKLVMRSKSKRYLDITDFKSKEIKKLKINYDIMCGYDDLEEGIDALIENNIPKIVKIKFRS